MKTLIVEDEFTGRAILQGILGGFGDCHVAVSAEEAVHAFKNSFQASVPYDLICMDIHLPGMNGIEAVKEIRDFEETHGVLSSQGVKILMATAIDKPHEVVESFKSLCDGYLIKPISAQALFEKLKALKLPN
jgi:two-component system chemotaxis response regulator CheY